MTLTLTAARGNNMPIALYTAVTESDLSAVGVTIFPRPGDIVMIQATGGCYMFQKGGGYFPLGITTPLPYYLVSTANAPSTNAGTVTTPAITTTGVTRLYAVTAGAGAAPTVTDSKSNSWTACTTYNGGSFYVLISYCNNPTVGTGHTFTGAHSSSYPGIAIVGFGGTVTSGAKDLDVGAAVSGGSYAGSSGSGTPAYDNEVVIGGICYGNTSGGSITTMTSVPPFTAGSIVPYNNGDDSGVGIAWTVPVLKLASNSQWVCSSSGASISGGAVALASFQS
jgi:hypothetical protein